MTELDLTGFLDNSAEQLREVSMTVNGAVITRTVPVRRLLSDFLRHDLALAGTHVGCEHGVCGACTVLIDGSSARACLQFAVQCDGATIRTIEGLSPEEPGGLSVVQEAFHRRHALQCGYCTPGYVVAVTEIVDEFKRIHGDDAAAAAEALTDEEIRLMVSGNICRCTGYQNIVAAARDALHESLAS